MDEEIKWKKLKLFQGVIYAEMIKEILDDKEIPNILQSGSNMMWTVQGASEVGADGYILVPEERFEECEDIVRQLLGDKDHPDTE